MTTIFESGSNNWISFRWRHNERDSVSNHQPHDCLLNRLFRRRSKKKSKLRVTGLCMGNSPGTGEFPAQTASYAENVSIWWRHNVPLSLLSFGQIKSCKLIRFESESHRFCPVILPPSFITYGSFQTSNEFVTLLFLQDSDATILNWKAFSSSRASQFRCYSHNVIYARVSQSWFIAKQ